MITRFALFEGTVNDAEGFRAAVLERKEQQHVAWATERRQGTCTGRDRIERTNGNCTNIESMEIRDAVVCRRGCGLHPGGTDTA